MITPDSENFVQLGALFSLFLELELDIEITFLHDVDISPVSFEFVDLPSKLSLFRNGQIFKSFDEFPEKLVFCRPVVCVSRPTL